VAVDARLLTPPNPIGCNDETHRSETASTFWKHSLDVNTKRANRIHTARPSHDGSSLALSPTATQKVRYVSTKRSQLLVQSTSYGVLLFTLA
jgi:hypothetical protein